MGTGKIIQADNIEGMKAVKNFIGNSLAAINTSGWATYKDATDTRPVDGTGGSASITWTRSEASPLSDAASFIFTKDAANRQGEGASYNFTIDSKDKAKVLKIEMDYIVESGTFVAGSNTTDSDLIVYIYDVTNGVLIEPSSFKFLSNSSTISDKFSATFQSAYNSTSYRLIIHTATTNASAYSLKIDNVSVSPSQYVYGTPITDWVSYTPTGSWTTNTTYSGRWRRVGDTLEVQARAALTGAPNAVGLDMSIPTGLSIDSTKVAATGFYNLGTLTTYTGSTFHTGNVTYKNSTSVAFVAQAISAAASHTAGDLNATNPNTYGTGGHVSAIFSVPILGWSSSVQMSDSVTWTDDVGQIVPFAKTTTPASVTDAPSGYLYADGSAVSRATYYELFSRIGTSYGVGDGSTTFNLPNLKGIFVRGAGSQTFGSETYSGTAGAKQNDATAKNGLTATSDQSAHSHNFTVWNNGGGTGGARSYLAAFSGTSGGTSGNYTPGGSSPSTQSADPTITTTINSDDSETRPANMALHYFIKYTRTAAPTISASETVACKYTNTAGTTIDTSVTKLSFALANKVYDTHGSWNGTEFTAPTPGIYSVNVTAQGIGAYPSAQYLEININDSTIAACYDSSTAQGYRSNSSDFELKAGDKISIVFRVSSGSTTLSTGAPFNYISIHKVK